MSGRKCQKRREHDSVGSEPPTLLGFIPSSATSQPQSLEVFPTVPVFWFLDMENSHAVMLRLECISTWMGHFINACYMFATVCYYSSGDTES